MTGTRLDRLFLLLENGSTRVIRKSAAEQIGEVQKLHPHELHNLLTKVHPYLVHCSWETRIAASQAVEAIAKNVPQWIPKPCCKKEEAPSGQTSARLRFGNFDIYTVLTQASSLLASEGKEFDLDEDIGLDQKEKLARQKELLNKKLGLDNSGRMGVTSGELFEEEDLVMTRQPSVSNAQSSVKEIFHQQMLKSNSGEMLSSRELNRVKRKAKLLAKQTSRDDSKDGDTSDPEAAPSKLRKTSSFLVNQPSEDKILMDSVPSTTLDLDQLSDWPFAGFCDVLMNELFNSSWEKRHGAAIGLRDVIRLHGKGAGVNANQTAAQQEASHMTWLEDLAVRIICVMALDRFGDFVSDEVVAPVRESCAQSLGALLQLLNETGVRQVCDVLTQLLCQTQWEVRHGGLLGLKYLLAVRQDLQESLLPQLIPVMFRGLQDVSDDVRAVAAASLVPVTDTLLTPGLSHHVKPIIESLWSTLQELDDLTASTNSIMTLLSSLLAKPQLPDNSMSAGPLYEMVPRLWPFLRHNISSVRKATLQTLATLLKRQKQHGGCAEWLVPILQDAFRHIYQRCLFEENKEILDLLAEVWCLMLECSSVDHVVTAVCSWLGVWLCLMMQPPTLPYDPAFLIEAKHPVREHTPTRPRPTQSNQLCENQQQQQAGIHKDYIGGITSLAENPVKRDIAVMIARTSAARLLGHLCECFTKPTTVATGAEGETPLQSLYNLLIFHLNSKSAIQRICIGLIVTHWAKISKPCLVGDCLKLKLHECLTSCIYYDEITLSFTHMQSESHNFIACLKQAGLLTNYPMQGNVLSLEQAFALCGSVFDEVKGHLKPRQLNTFEERRRGLEQTVTQTANEHNTLSVRVQMILASAVIEIEDLPQKMNPVVRPLMECIKKEMNPDFQIWASSSLSKLLDLCTERSPCPNPKVVKNLVTMLCSDPSFTPPLTPSEGKDPYSGILTLNAHQGLEQITGRGRRPTLLRHTMFTDASIPLEATINQDDDMKRQLMVQRRGAALALSTVAKHCSSAMPHKLPHLWKLISSPFSPVDGMSNGATDSEETTQELVHALQVLQVLGPHLHCDLIDQLISGIGSFKPILLHAYTCVRHMASRCLAMLCGVVTGKSMNFVLEQVLPSLGASENLAQREGAIEAFSNIVDELGVTIVPYIVLLIVPVLGCMSDQKETVRLMATHCFASLVRLMPLEGGTESPGDMSRQLVEMKEKERHFLEQLLDGSKLDNYTIPVPIDAQLRKYQQDGVNWLCFLNKYKLHGILCDDMGLGKTLMSLCILAGDHFLRDKTYQETKQADCAPLPSIVVCPPTLTGHWIYEVEKFVQPKHLKPLHYTGPPAERYRLQKHLPDHNLVVASYDVVRNDIDFFSSVKWNYCILDEGHIIKNSKTKLSQSVKRLECSHRLILSGTPIQNNVLELWSLFDFLMPGFLGTEKQFQVRFGRPILQSRDAKSSSKEQEAGALAMEALHRQVLPFILRRLKENVLQDLPPKIIQDYYCDLSPLQVQLYEDFAKSRAKSGVEESLLNAGSGDVKSGSASSNIFQALQYLKKLCNHPALVLNAQHPEYNTVTAQLKARNSKLRSLEHSPKLTALQQLLTDCGIGVSASAGSGDPAPAVNQHRALIFCQLKSMLDILESDLLKCHMPDVTYLRLDGTVPAGNRHGIVSRFNNDPSIDLLLLTTHVGGLGLNLTGADTVIFVEHDWNPMKDLQAMDRAHRIGQKRVVNVYRLITRGTLEEKIMGLQKFKLNIANTVISQENASLASMGTDQLLDLFSLSPNSDKGKEKAADSHKCSLKEILANEKELWDEDQYETEYDLGKFVENLRR